MNIALIAARGGSKGLPRKNILPLAGTPLIGWTILAAQKAGCIDEVFVSTEDNEIAAVSREYGANVIDRPDSLATDFATSEAVITHALDVLAKDDISSVFFLQVTSPLRNETHISEAYDVYRERGASCVISVYEPDVCIAKAYREAEDGSLTGAFGKNSPYTRRQDLPPMYMPNGAIYIFSRDEYMQSQRIPRSSVFPYLMSESESVDVDTVEDLVKCEKILEGREHE